MQEGRKIEAKSDKAFVGPVLDEWLARCTADNAAGVVKCSVTYAMNSDEGVIEIVVDDASVSAAPDKNIGIVENTEVQVDKNAPISSDQNSDVDNSIKEEYATLIKQMKEGKSMAVAFVRFNSASPETRVPLTGFTKAYQQAGFSGGS